MISCLSQPLLQPLLVGWDPLQSCQASCWVVASTIPQFTIQQLKKKDGTTQLEFSPCSFSFHHPILKKRCLFFFLAASALYANSFRGKLQTTFDPTHLVPLGRSDLKSDSCWLPHPRPWSDDCSDGRFAGGKLPEDPNSLHPFIPGFFLKTFDEDFKTLRL